MSKNEAPLQIRQMELSELDEVIDLHLEGLEREISLLNQIIAGKSVDLTGRQELKKVLYQMWHIEECNIFVAREGKALIGYCLATRKVYPVETPKVCGCINGIYVKDSARKKGVGTRLFQLARDWFKVERISYIELYHMINDARATAFWKKMGFTAVQLNCAMKI